MANGNDSTLAIKYMAAYGFRLTGRKLNVQTYEGGIQMTIGVCPDALNHEQKSLLLSAR